MTEINNSYKKNLDKVKLALTNLYSQLKKDKNYPSTLHQLSKELLPFQPNSLLLNTLEIKSYYEKPSKELDACFPSNYFLLDDKKFKTSLYDFCSMNVMNYNNNSKIIDGLKNIIKNIPKESAHNKYLELIEVITKKMNDENAILCKLLVTTPYKYKELIIFVDTTLNISILPKNAENFYSISKIDENKRNFENFFEKDKDREDIQELKNQIKNLTESVQTQKKDYEDKILSVQNQINEIQKELLAVRIRNAISLMMNKIIWAFNLKSSDSISVLLCELSEVLGKLTSDANETERKGASIIKELMTKIKGTKWSGNDSGHLFINIGFNEKSLPDEVLAKYLGLKKDENINVYGFDTMALILSFKEINEYNKEKTKSIYQLFENIFRVPTRNWEVKKQFLATILKNYHNEDKE